MTKPRKKHFIVSLLGVLFYIAGTIGWLWALLPYLPDLARISTSLQQPVLPTEPIQQAAITTPPSLLLIIGVIAITVLVFGLTIYALIKLPSTVARTGTKFTKKTTEYVIPLVTHRAELSQKKRRQLTTRVMFYVKLTFCVVPVIVAACSFMVTAILPYDIILLISTFLAVTALALLCLQVLFAKWLHVKLDSL